MIIMEFINIFNSNNNLYSYLDIKFVSRGTYMKSVIFGNL